VVVWAAGLTKSAGAQAPDPRLVFHTLRSEHFEIVYHDPLGPMAQRLAMLAERAHQRVSKALGFLPSQDTRILLTDDSDDANGLADVIPRNQIHLFAAAPDDLSSIGDYDDWLATLVTHEYTHILHLDQIGGIPGLLNAVLGKTVAPNALQPQWFIEGLAVYEESAQTAGGRMRSSIFDMELRMDALDDALPTLAQISNNPVRWPHGDLRYLYGSRFVSFIAEHFGDEALTRIGHAYGRDIFPYGLNRVAQRATGFTFVALYDQFRAQVKQRYAEQRAAVLAAGVVAGRTIARHADVTRTPRFLPDGRLAYYADDGRFPASIRTLDGETLTRASGEAVFSPDPFGQHVVYSQPAPHRDIYLYHDLFSLDLSSGESERLTLGLRASQPDVSPDGREVAFVTQQSGASQLELARLDDIAGTRRVLFRGRTYDQVFTPRFSPDGKQLAVSAWRAGGHRDIWLIDAVSGSARELTHDRAIDSGPTWSPDGQRVYFSSDRTGIANIFAFELTTGLTYQVTNVLGGAFQPVVSPDGKRLVYVDYARTGFGLCELTLADHAPWSAPANLDLRPSPTNLDDPAPLPVHDYQPLDTLLPQSYRLDLTPGALGEELFVEVAGNDIANFHSYSLRVGLPLTQPDKPEASLYYAYNRMPLRPAMQLYRHLSTRDDLSVAGQTRRWAADAIGGSVGLSYVFQSIRRSQSLELDYSLAHIDKARPFGGRLDPTDPPPRLPQLGFMPSVGFGYRYSDLTSEAYDISNSGGRTLTFHLDVTDPIMGRSVHTVAARWEVRQFLKTPWQAQHIVALRYAGGLAAGDTSDATTFSLGGFPKNASFPSLYDLIVFGSVPSLDGTALRGYPEGFRSGRQFHQVQLEYRLPLLDPEWGVYTLPLYLRRLWASVFADAGGAFYGRPKPSDLLVGSGAELFAQLVVSYRVTLDLRLGFARGWSAGGETQGYFHIGTPF
jgi:WD40-like Beta Propeller Repeat